MICNRCSYRLPVALDRPVVCRCGNRIQPGGPRAQKGQAQKTPLPAAACIHRGESTRQLDCGCAGVYRAFACTNPIIGGECLPLLPSQLRGAPAARGLTECSRCPSRQPGAGLRFVRSTELPGLCQTLAAQLPADLAGVIGVARSGVAPAALLAMQLHLPLWILRPQTRDIIPADHGWRLSQGRPLPSSGRYLVIDDTVMTGHSLGLAQRIVAASPFAGRCDHAALFRNPQASKNLPLRWWAEELAPPHYLEWNLFNSIHTPHLALDFDGVLCLDCPPGSDDDGERYLQFLAEARPLHLPRRAPVAAIVTARLEKYRRLTEQWLARHGVAAKQLIMGPWATLAERRRSDVAAWKASEYRRLHAALFAESEPAQAERIAQLTGRPVLCPQTGEIL